MLGVSLSQDGIVTPTSAPANVTTTGPIILTIPTSGSRAGGARASARRARAPGGVMLGHPVLQPAANPRKVNEMTYSGAGDPYRVFRDSSNTLANTVGRRVVAHPAVPKSALRGGPPPASLARGQPYAGYVAGVNEDWHGHATHSHGMIDMDEALLPARKPRLPSGARGSTRKRTSETATQTVTTVGTQTEAARAAASRAAELIGGGGALGERGTLGGPPLWRVHAVGDEDGGAAAPAHAHPAASPLRVPGVAVGTSPGRAPALGSPGRRSSVGSSASSAEQLEQLDSLLREHQQLLKARVDGVRVDHQRKQRDWFASAGQEPPSPPRAAGRGGAGAGQPPRSGAQQAAAATRGSCAPPEGPSSRPTSAPPTPARGAALGMHGSALSAGLSPRARKEDKGCNSEPDIAPSMRSSLESLAELETLLEEQHRQLIAKGYIEPSREW